jgi:DNA mismatch repair protein MutS
VLTTLEKGEPGGALTRLAEDLPLFAVTRPVAPTALAEPSALDALIAGLQPDELTPKAALDLLYKMRALRDGGG